MGLIQESGGALRWTLRGLAVVVAVVIGVFVVRDNHRRAQPVPEAVPPAGETAPAATPRQAETPAARGPAEAEPTPLEVDPTFFHTSKAMAPPTLPPAPADAAP